MHVMDVAAGFAASARLVAAQDTGKAGPLGLLVVIMLVVVCYFLFKSMSRHLRKVRDEFPADHPAPDAPAPKTSDPPSD